MSELLQYGASKRGKRTLVYRGCEFWREKENKKGQTHWRCSKRQSLQCKARLVTDSHGVVGNKQPEHNHSGNVATALARKAVHEMKLKMQETVATPSSSQGAIAASLDNHVFMALPKRDTLTRALRLHRQRILTISGTGALPPLPTDLNFEIPERFRQLVLFDSGPGSDRILMFGDQTLLIGLERSRTWLADGTFKLVPTLYFQMYSIHFEYIGGCNPAAIYCLLSNKTRHTYERVFEQLKRLVPAGAPEIILTDFETAAMHAFKHEYPNATTSGCYFHLCQSVIRNVSYLGLKEAYETDN